MSEFISRAIPVALAGTLAITSSGCDAFESGPKILVERCYDTAQDSPDLPERPEYIPPERIDYPDSPALDAPQEEWDAHDKAVDAYFLHSAASDKVYDVHVQATKDWEALKDPANIIIPVPYGFAEGDPVVPEDDVREIATSGLVKIATDKGKGTGFATKNESGEVVIITAAHVVGEIALDDLTIITDSGETTQPANGCYIYDDEGAHVDIAQDSTPEHDIAVLTLTEELPLEPLELSKTKPEPGTWVNLINYQGSYGPNGSNEWHELYPRPAGYTGLITPQNPDKAGLAIVTGARDLGDEITIADFERTHMVGGASGGPVLNQQGEVVGISTSSHKRGVKLDLKTFADLYDVEFPGADDSEDSGFWPTGGAGMNTDQIRTILNAPLPEIQE